MKPYIVVLSMGTINAHLAARLLEWKQYEISIKVGYSPVDHARNEAVRDFLKTDCTHLLFIDEDTIPPSNAVSKLLEADKPVVTGLTPIYRVRDDKPYVITNCFIYINKEKTEEINPPKHQGLVKIDRCGASCLMIQRKVLENMESPWFQNVFNKEYTDYMAEDLTFCMKFGSEIWCDTDVVCKHAKTVLL